MDWGADPSWDWPSRFSPGDVVRLGEDQIAVVVMVSDYSSDPARPKYELLLNYRLPTGALDDSLFPPWVASPAPDERSREEARSQGLFDEWKPPETN